MLTIINKTQKAYKSILDKIQDGTFASGQILSEAKLAENLDMTRTPVREALAMLANEKLVESVGRATRVRIPQDTEILEHLLDRFAFELWVVLTLARRNKHEGRIFEQLDSILGEMNEVRDNANENDSQMFKKFTELDFDFHCHMAAEARRPMIADYLIRYKNIFMLYAKMRNSPQSLVAMGQVLEEHRAILDAIRRGKGEEAVWQVRNHILKTVRRRRMPFYEEIEFELNSLEEFDLLRFCGEKTSPAEDPTRAQDSRRGKRNK